MQSLLPNTTQIPHIILREWMPLLKDVELRVLLVVIDQTLGWIEDVETGRRKEKDWISHSQLIKKTGRSDRGISKAVKRLVDELTIVEAYDESGNHLDKPEKRQKCGYRIYYRLNLKAPQPTLFDTPAKNAEGKKQTSQPPQKVRTQKVLTTKVTPITKNNNSQTAKPPARDPNKKYSDHALFIDFWYETVQTTRGIQPVITKADARNLKRVLDLNILSPPQLEQLALFFLADYGFRQFSPSISTFLSSGILNGLQNKMRNGEDFWKNLTNYAERYLRKPTQTDNAGNMVEKLAELKKSLFNRTFLTNARQEYGQNAPSGDVAAKT